MYKQRQKSCQVIHTSHRAHAIIVNYYIHGNQPLSSSLMEKVFIANKKKLASDGGNKMVAQNNNVLLTCTVQAKGESSLCLFMRRITRHRWELIFSVKYMASDPGCSAHMQKYTPYLLTTKTSTWTKHSMAHVYIFYSLKYKHRTVNKWRNMYFCLQLGTGMIFYKVSLSIHWKYIVTRGSQAPKRTKKHHKSSPFIINKQWQNVYYGYTFPLKLWFSTREAQ